MLDRFARHLFLWVGFATIPAVAAAATWRGAAAGGWALHSAPAVLLLTGAAVTLATTAALMGWRALSRRLEGDRHADQALHEQARRLHEAMQASVDGQFVLRAVHNGSGQVVDFEITDANMAGASLLYRSRPTVVGKRLCRDFGVLGASLFARYARAVATGTPVVEDVRVNRRLVGASWLLHQAIPTSDGLAITARDISEAKHEERLLRKASLTDDLTGLYNRRGFMALAEQQLRTTRRQGVNAVVLYADMDGFKGINDTYGHAVGDQALIAVGRLLRETVRDCDLVARLGGDEFTVLACDADGTGARAIQQRIDEHLARLNASGALPAPLQLTIGFTRVRPSDQAGIAELLARADALLYTRKRRRRLTANAALHTPGPVVSTAPPTPYHPAAATPMAPGTPTTPER